MNFVKHQGLEVATASKGENAFLQHLRELLGSTAATLNNFSGRDFVDVKVCKVTATTAAAVTTTSTRLLSSVSGALTTRERERIPEMSKRFVNALTQCIYIVTPRKLLACPQRKR